MSTLAFSASAFAGEAVAVQRRVSSNKRAVRATRCAASDEVRPRSRSSPKRLIYVIIPTSHPYGPRHHTFSTRTHHALSNALNHSYHEQKSTPLSLTRRGFGAAAAAMALTMSPSGPANAVQGMTAGRVPGLAPADGNGVRRYTRPEGKSGGHGVGWTEITPYTFDVYEGWEEIPVSIADPGGTEIDVRFNSDEDGGLKIVLAPVLRFTDVPEGANPTIEELIPFERFMAGFGPELTQNPVDDDMIVDRFVDKRDGLMYYNFELKDHTLVAATVWKKRVNIICLKAPARQWRASADKLRNTMKSFKVLTAQA